MGKFKDSLPTKPKDLIPGYHPYRRLKAAGESIHNFTNPKAPPGPPTIDEAQQSLAESDRLRRRRGVYANIFAGNAAAPVVGKATLGG